MAKVPALKMSSALVVAACAVVTLVLLRFRKRRALRDAETSSSEISSKGFLVCSMCKRLQMHTCYTAKQARRHDHLRKCRGCVATFEATPEYLEESATRRAEAVAARTAKARTPVVLPSVADSVDDPLRLARKAETVLCGRTERVCLVLENCSDDLNHVAIMRTCEALGVQRVWLVQAATKPTEADDASANVKRLACSRARRRHEARAAQRGLGFDPLLGVRRAQLYAQHLDVQVFQSTAACVLAARTEGRALWVTDLAQDALPLGSDVAALAAVLPPKVAIVVGSEGAGVSQV